MTKWSAIRAVVCAITAAGSTGVACGDDAAGDVFLFETEHFRYSAAGADSLACDRAPYWLERSYEALSGYLGLALPAGARIDYHLVPEAEISNRCGKVILGCTVGLHVMSILPVHTHEIVHVLADTLGRAPALFEEGLAVMLGCGYPGAPLIDTSAPIETLLASRRFREEFDRRLDLYSVAGSFVRHLVDSVGKDAFLAFYGRVTYDSDDTAIEDAFQSVTGVPLATLIASWRAAPRHYDEICLYPMECAEEPAPSGRAFTAGSGCGPSANRRVSEVMVPFEVGPTGRALLTVDGAVPGALAVADVFRCDGGNVAGRSIGIGDFFIDVPPGEYFFHADWGGEAAPLSLRVSDVGAPPASTACVLSDGPLELRPGRPLHIARRWTSETCAGFPWCPGLAVDVVPAAPGRLIPIVPPRETGGPPVATDFYLCDAACPADPAATCVMDRFANGGSPGETFEVVNRPVDVGETLHLATGPGRSDDIQSISLLLAPP
jgi:hypothetical protein